MDNEFEKLALELESIHTKPVSKVTKEVLNELLNNFRTKNHVEYTIIFFEKNQHNLKVNSCFSENRQQAWSWIDGTYSCWENESKEESKKNPLHKKGIIDFIKKYLSTREGNEHIIITKCEKKNVFHFIGEYEDNNFRRDIVYSFLN